MLVPAGSSIFFLREHRFAVRCRVVTLRQLLWTLFNHVECVFIAHILIYILHKYWMRNSILPFYDTVYNMSFNSKCRILAAKLNYRFTEVASYS